MKLFLISTFLLLSYLSFSQEIKGLINDKESKEPIPFAKIFFTELETGTIADSNGVFFIEHFNQESIHLNVSAYGYLSLDTILQMNGIHEIKFSLRESHLDLEEVVITASTGKLEGDNIVSIDKRKLEDLYQNSPLSLAEAISNIPGVDQNTTGAGIGKPVIRGLSGNRIVTYSQGIRVENQQWGSEHGLGIGSVGIESVEVIKGPASLLYGSDAMGGVLYFVDERYANHNSIEVKGKTSFQSNTLGTISNFGFKIHKGIFKMNLFGAYSSHADYQTPEFKNVYNSRFDEKNIKASFGFNKKNWISNIRYSYLENNFGLVEDSTYTSTFGRSKTLPNQNIRNHAVSFSNKFYTGASSIELILGFTSNDRREFEDNQNDQALGFMLNTGTYNLKWKSPFYFKILQIVVGSQGMYQSNKNSGVEILVPDAKTIDVGAFTMLHFKWKKFQLQGGFRIDNRQIDTRFMQSIDTTFLALNRDFTGKTFSLGANYKLKKIIFRANVSSGFRAPNSSELLSNGVHEGTNRYEIGNASLKNEQAIQADISMDYQSNHFSFSINPFYNSINNYIFISPTNAILNSNPVYQYSQTNAFLYGGEVGLHYHPHVIHWLHLQSEFSTVFAEDRNQRNLPLIPQTRIKTTAAVELKQNGKIHFNKIFIEYVYKFQQNRVGQFETFSPEYNLVNLGVKMEVETKNNPVEINFGVKNLLNTHYIDHLSRFKKLQIANQGINFYVGVSYKINRILKK